MAFFGKKNTSSAKQDIRIDMMEDKDIPAVVEIDNASFEYSWSAEAFAPFVHEQRLIAKVVWMGEKIVGYYCYEKQQGALRLMNMAVHPDYRKKKIGTLMMQDIMKTLDTLKSGSARKDKLIFECDEYNLGFQLFVRSLCKDPESPDTKPTDPVLLQHPLPLRGYYEDSGHDAIGFEITTKELWGQQDHAPAHLTRWKGREP